MLDRIVWFQTADQPDAPGFVVKRMTCHAKEPDLRPRYYRSP